MKTVYKTVELAIHVPQIHFITIKLEFDDTNKKVSKQFLLLRVTNTGIFYFYRKIKNQNYK